VPASQPPADKASTESAPPPSSKLNGEAKPAKKKKSAAAIQKELRDLGRPDPDAPVKPPVDLKKIFTRVGLILALLWAIAIAIHHVIGFAIAGVITVAVAGVSVWFVRYLKKSETLGSILRGADTEEGRKAALQQLETGFKKGDTQAVLARAQLEMQEDPRKALATLESVNLDKVIGPIADQFRAMRAMIHLTLGETAQARALADNLDLGKQQEPKTRATFATVASEAWARTGQAKKAIETLELFNPEDPEFSEVRAQMWRARAFAYAGANDMKGASRALKKLAEISPQLLAMFMGNKKVHPLLEREAKQMLMKSGAVPRKMVRQRM
jgi:tetratricopeptide (TPR) repeat protein